MITLEVDIDVDVIYICSELPDPGVCYTEARWVRESSNHQSPGLWKIFVL